MIHCRKYPVRILIMMTCMILMSCQSIDQQHTDDLITEDIYQEPTEKSPFTELSSTTGQSTVDIPFADHFPLEINDSPADGYEKPTGKWMMADGEGRFGYTIPNGMIEAGSKIQVGLIHATDNNNELERDVRVQINPCSNINACEKPIVDQTEFASNIEDEFIVYEGTIPSDVDRLYLISLEIIDDGVIEDTLTSYVYVPNEELNASIELEQETSDQFTFLLTNYGPTTLTIGEDFTIEQYMDEKWLIVPYQAQVKDIAWMVYPGDVTSFTVDTSTFPEGSYRLVKGLYASPYALEEVIAAPFSVE